MSNAAGNDPQGGPFHQSTFFWGCAGTAITIILAVLAAMIKDLRWLLIFAWPFAVLAIRELSKSYAVTRGRGKLITVIGAIIAAVSLMLLYWNLAPVTTFPPKLQSVVVTPSPLTALPLPRLPLMPLPSHLLPMLPPPLPPDAGGAKLIYPAPEGVQRRGRIFVDISPDDMKKEFDGRTEYQAQALLAPYIDKWIAVSGVLYDMHIFDHREQQVVVSMTTNETIISGAMTVYGRFGMKWKPYIDIITKNDKISAACQIGDINQLWIDLIHCELIN